MAEETAKNFASEEKADFPSEINVSSAGNFLTAIGDNRTSNDELLCSLTDFKDFLKTQPRSSLTDFGQNELNKLSRVLEQIYFKTDLDVNRGEKLHLECIYCLKELLNNTAGLQLIVANKGVIRELCKSLDYTFPSIMIAALESLSVICFLSDGHKYILQALTEIYEDQKDFQRFSMIIDGLSMNNDALACSCWKFTNSVINSSNNLDLRLHLRNEFMRSGLRDVFKDMEKSVLQYRSKETEMQLNIFHRYRENDCDKIFQRFDNLRFQFEDIDECYELIKTSILDTECEPLLLSILQHLLYIRDDPKIRLAYYRLIEECISQIVIHHSGCDPDFRTSRKVTIYVNSEIGQLPPKDDENKEYPTDDVYQKIEEIVMAKQALENKISELENELMKYRKDGTQTSDETQTSKKVQFSRISTKIPDSESIPSDHLIKVENGKMKIVIPKSPDKPYEVRPSFLHSIRFRSKSCSGNNIRQKEIEEKVKKAKEAAEKVEKTEKERTKREEKKQVLQKAGRAARQSKVDRSMARRSAPPVDEFEGIQVSNICSIDTASVSKVSSSTLKTGPVSPIKTTNEETGKSKPRWH